MPYTPIVATMGYVMSSDGQQVLLIHRNARPDDTHAELGRLLTRQLRHALAAALDAEGMFLYWDKLVSGRWEWEPIVALFERAHALSVHAGDARGISETLFHLGLTRQFRGDSAGARGFYERSLAVARAAGDAPMQSYAVRHLGDFSEERGDLDTALALNEESLRLREQVGFRTGQVFALLSVARILSLREPRSDAALAAVQRALRMAEATKDPSGLRESLGALGRLHLRREDATAALPYLEQALANAEAHEDWLTTVELLLDVARAHAQRGERPRVEALLRRARALTTERGLCLMLTELEQRELGVAPRWAARRELPLASPLGQPGDETSAPRRSAPSPRRGSGAVRP